MTVLFSHLCLDVSEWISDIILVKHSGRSGVIRVLFGRDKLAFVNVDPVDFPEIGSASLQVLTPL